MVTTEDRLDPLVERADRMYRLTVFVLAITIGWFAISAASLVLQLTKQ